MKPLIDPTEYVAPLTQAYSQPKKDESNWQTSWTRMKQSLMEQNSAGNLAHNNAFLSIESQIHKFYQCLKNTREFNDGLHMANTKERSNDPWLGQQLFTDGDMEVNLNVFFGNFNTPIHDRARKAEAFIVLSGRAHLQHFAIVPTPIQSHYPIIKLSRGESETLEHHQVCLIHAGVNSVHEVDALTGRCVVLRISIFDTDVNSPCWYFPISPQQNQEFFTQRVKQF